MKLHSCILIVIMLCAGNICQARRHDKYIGNNDSVLNRVWDYHLQIRQYTGDSTCNMYVAYYFQTNHRNALLRILPSMNSIASGDTAFSGDVYGTLMFHDKQDYEFSIHQHRSTIPKQGKPISPLFEIVLPDVYGEHFYKDRLLSPFHRNNERFYTYTVTHLTDSTARIDFKSRIESTQLVDGHAIVSSTDGYIISIVLEGEFDMLEFTTTVDMLPDSCYQLPLSSNTKAKFRCLGNDIDADFTYIYNMPQHVADSIMVDDTIPDIDTAVRKKNWYDGIMRATMEKKSDSTNWGTGRVYFGYSPLLNPTYMGFSSSKGVSLKLKFHSSYIWPNERFLTFNPVLGYYTRKRQFYYNLPLEYNYNRVRHGKAGIVWANGNRVSNSAMKETFNENVGHDTISMPDYYHQYFLLYNEIGIWGWARLNVGIDYHLRKAMGKHQMIKEAGLKVYYFNFAPFITLKIMPWDDRGPVLSGNVERSMKDVLGSNMSYCRYEFDAQYKHKMRGMRRLNLRTGTGFYTHSSTEYFVDFSNFQDNNLPTGWDDDWSGQFQLVESRLYNESKYYIRGHISYESPLLALSWLPIMGRYIESERLYLSALNTELEHHYMEIGYGFKCKYFSTGIFASFCGTEFDAIECKFTFELFNRW